MQVQIQVYKESNISVYVNYFACLCFIKLWNKMKYILLRQCTYVFNCYCCHYITNISQCNSIHRNREKLNKIHDNKCFFLLYEHACNTKVKADLHPANLSPAADAIRWWTVFFNLHLRRTKCSVYLTNLFFFL